MRAGMVLLAALVLSLPLSQGPEGTALVRGRVVDAVTKKPIRNVALRFNPERRAPFTPGIDTSLPPRSAITDARGVFEIANLAAAAYTIYSTGNSGDYLDISYGSRGPGGGGRPLQVAEGARLDITLDAWPAASIAGRVLDERGRPVVGAGVRLVSRLAQAYGSATTDDRGEYLIARLPPGDYTVGVPVTLTSRTLNAAPRVRGAPDYRPPLQPYLLDRAARTILLPYGAPLPPPAADGRTNVYVTTYYGGTSIADAKYFSLTAGQARLGVDLTLRAEPGFRVAGTAVGPAGPVEGLVLTLFRDGTPESSQLHLLTANAAADGAFVFVAVPPGSYRLTATRRVPSLTEASISEGGPAIVAMDDVIDRDKNALWAEVPLTVGGEDVDGVAVMVRPGTAIAGRIVFDDQTAVSIPDSPRISLGRIGSESFMDDVSLQVGRDGTFAARAKPGQYLLNAPWPVSGRTFMTARLGGRDIGDGPIAIGDTPAADLELVYGRGSTMVRGSVADATSNPVSDAAIVVFPVDPIRWDRVEEHNRGRVLRLTAPTYEITRLVAGEYYIAALDERVMRATMSRGLFERLAGSASRVHVRVGEPVTANLTVLAEKSR